MVLEGVTESAGNLTGEHMDLGTATDLKLNLLPLAKLSRQTHCKAPYPHSQGKPTVCPDRKQEAPRVAGVSPDGLGLLGLSV
jgi:hypothetical protein